MWNCCSFESGADRWAGRRVDGPRAHRWVDRRADYFRRSRVRLLVGIAPEEWNYKRIDRRADQRAYSRRAERQAVRWRADFRADRRADRRFRNRLTEAHFFSRDYWLEVESVLEESDFRLDRR